LKKKGRWVKKKEIKNKLIKRKTKIKKNFKTSGGFLGIEN